MFLSILREIKSPPMAAVSTLYHMNKQLRLYFPSRPVPQGLTTVMIVFRVLLLNERRVSSASVSILESFVTNFYITCNHRRRGSIHAYCDKTTLVMVVLTRSTPQYLGHMSPQEYYDGIFGVFWSSVCDVDTTHVYAHIIHDREIYPSRELNTLICCILGCPESYSSCNVLRHKQYYISSI